MTDGFGHPKEVVEYSAQNCGGGTGDPLESIIRDDGFLQCAHTHGRLTTSPQSVQEKPGILKLKPEPLGDYIVACCPFCKVAVYAKK